MDLHFRNRKDSPILSIPFVVRAKILKQFTLKEQLKLREVCRTTKFWVDSSRLLTDHIPITNIGDYGIKTFSTFLERKPSHLITSIFIDNENCDFLFDPALPYFLQECSTSYVKRLHVKRYFTCNLEEERNFYESFINLEELEISKISISSASEVSTQFPRNFKNLKTLKIGSVKAFPEPPDDLFAADLIPLERQRPMGLYVWNLIRFCDKLEFLGYPKTSKYFFQAFADGRGRGEFGAFCDYIEERKLNHPNCPNLKVCDFQNDNWSPDSKNALTLLKLGNRFGIEFRNVNANLFQYIKINSLIQMYELSKNSGDCIVSLKNFNCLITECLPKINKISLSASEVNTMLDYSCVFNGPKAFPNLREIIIVIDVGYTESGLDKYRKAREFRDVHILLSHFFYDMEMILLADNANNEKQVRIYENVETLTIQFNDFTNQISKKAAPEDLPLKWIVKGLPNLRKLKLVGWKTERSETYSTLWESFPNLEELHLEDCENITDLSLTGIFNLKKLVRVTMKEKGKNIDTSMLKKDNFYPSEFLNQSNQRGYLTWMRVSSSD